MNSLTHKIVFAAIVLLAATTSIQAQKSRAWLNGTWQGTGYQMDTDTTWTMLLTASKGKYTIEYPSLKCGGRWQLITIDKWTAKFRERISHGLEDCVNNGSVVIQRLGNGQIAFRYYNRGSARVTASAILNRKPRQ